MAKKKDEYRISDISGNRLPDNEVISFSRLWKTGFNGVDRGEFYLTIDLSPAESAKWIKELTQMLNDKLESTLDSAFGDKWRHRLSELE